MKRIIVSISVIAAFLVCCVSGLSISASEPVDIKDAVITASNSTYTGSALTPAVTVKVTVTDGEGNPSTVTLVKDTDYKVTYTNNINVGTANINVSGIGSYTGTATGHFTVLARPISDSAVTVKFTERSKVGRAPKLTVSYNGKTLKSGTDYTVEFSKYDKAGYGTGKAKITGKGNFSGSVTKDFNVYPTIVKGIKVTEVKQNYIKLAWNSKSGEGVSGYKVYKADDLNGKNAKLLATVSSTSATINNVDSSTVYRLFVVAYKTNSGNTVKSDLSSACVTCTLPNKPTLNYVVKKKKNRIYANWVGVYNPTGYEIKYSRSRKFKNASKVKVAASKKGRNIKVPDNGYAYFVKIRAYKTYKKDGKNVTVYGPWSVKMSSIFGRVYKEYTTTYPYNPNRTTNLKLACKAIDGTIVKPGGVFSFNATVGQRTAAKGYKPAPIFTGATTHADGVGGGICQVATTMFNAALLANFKIVERYQHSQKVAYCPAGRDSAIYWGSENFRFKNNTKYPIKIRMTCANGKVICRYMVSYKIKAPAVTLNVAKNGKHYKLTRTVKGKVNYTTNSTY